MELYTWYVSVEGDMTIPICKPPNKQCLGLFMFRVMHQYPRAMKVLTLRETIITVENQHFLLGKSTINGNFQYLC
jgi:hypothetical protein